MNDTIDELSPEARALLARAIDGDDPAPSDRARVRATLMATVAGGAGIAASTAASTAAASSAAASATASATGAVTMSLTAKIACAVILASAVGGTVAVAPWEPAPAVESHPEASSERPSSPPAVEPRIEAIAAPPAVELAPSPEPAVAIVEASLARPAPPTRHVRPAPERAIAAAPIEERSEVTVGRRVPSAAGTGATNVTAAEPADAPPAPSTLADELRLLASAQRALNDGDPTTALARLAEHGRRFPSGIMAEERDAARALALCRAGRREEAQAAAARFLAERPTSPLAARVRASCD